jgi:uncharacterized protein (DUF2062 family)
MHIKRRLRYYYLKLIRLKGQPKDLALGMALGVLAGSMPILPLQTWLALTLAFIFRASKIAAMLGTWISNPLNWYFLYLFSYKIGAWILGLEQRGKTISAVIYTIKSGGDPTAIAKSILEAGNWIVAAFLLGGFVLAAVTTPPSYFLSLYFFRRIEEWKRNRKSAGRGCFMLKRSR